MNNRIAILREAITKITQILAGNGIKVTQRGLTAGVKRDAKGSPIEVNLPYLPDNCPDDLINAIQGFLDKEVGHLLFTNFDVAMKARKQGVYELFDIIEGIQVEKSMARRFNGSGLNVATMRQFFINKFLNFEVKKLESSGTEQDLKELSKMLIAPAFRSYAGQTEFTDFLASRDLMKYVKPVTDRLGVLLNEVGSVTSSEGSLDLAMRMQDLLKNPNGGGGEGSEEQEGGEATEQTQQSKGKGKGKGKGKKSDGSDGDTKDEEKNPNGKGSGDSEQPSDGDQEAEADAGGENGGDGDDSEGDGGGDNGGDGDASDGNNDSSGNPGGSGGGESDDDGDDDSQSGGDGDDGDDDDSVDYSEQDNPGHNKSSQSGGDQKGKGAFVESITDDLSVMISSGKSMGEVVAHIASNEVADAAAASDYIPYSTDFDEIKPLSLKDGYEKWDDSMLTKIEQKTASVVAPLQKDLERAIAAKTLSRWHPGQRKGRLHAGNLSRLITGDDRVFRRQEVSTSKDTAVTLLVDCSGSMQGPKLATAATTAFALSQVLERIGITHEVIGFTTGDVTREIMNAYHADTVKTNGKVEFSRVEPIIMPLMKGFDERPNLEVKRRIAFLPNWNGCGANIDGESIQVAHRRLLKRKEHRKVMMVLSDGSPAGGNGRAVYDHLKKVIEEIEDSPTSIVGIGIQSNAVSKFYKNHVVISEVSDLPGKVMGELKKMLLADG